MDELLKKLQELTEAVQARNAGESTFDFDRLKGEFAVLMSEITDQQIQAALDRQPVRRMAGATHGPEGRDISVPKTNRYFRHVKGLVNDGFHREMNSKMMPIDLWLTHALLTRAARDNSTIKGPSADLTEALKALAPTSVGAGDEYVPTGMAESLWMDFFMMSRIAGSITTIPMPTDPFDVPLGMGAPTWRKGRVNVAANTPDMATGKSTLQVTEIVAGQSWAYSMEEDAVLVMMPAVRQELGRSGAEMIDDFALNADNTFASTGNINSDDATPNADDYFLSDGQDGIRHQHLVDNTGQTVDIAGVLTPTKVAQVFAKMGKYATDPGNSVITCDISTYLSGFMDSANFPDVATIDKFGPQATVLTGQLAAYRGVPIIPSPVYRLSAADGKVDVATPGNNTKGGLSIYHRLMWYLGFRRQLLIEVDRDIQTRQHILVASFREAIASRGTRSSNTHTAGGRNITV